MSWEDRFAHIGIDMMGASGGQGRAVCPFCGRPKFYFNLGNGLWD